MRDSLTEAATERLAEKISRWLPAPDPSVNLAAARDKRQQDTGTWLLASPVFLQWKVTDNSFLWLYGKPGSGKTILSSTVIYSLLDIDSERPSVLYFYFDFQDREKQLVRSLLKHIIVQLSLRFKPAAKTAESLYISHSRGSTIPTLQEMKETVKSMLATSPTVYLLVDALDECRDRVDLLDFFKDLREWKHVNLHAFATSRCETEIEDSLSALTTVQIALEESVVEGDILFYIERQLEQDARLSRWSQEIKSEIRTALLTGSNGMFRWVECQLDAIRKCKKPAQVRKTLRSLPATLDDTYARILANVEEDFVEDVRRILSCLICSFYPFAIEEVAETVAIVSEGDNYYDIDSRLFRSRDILTICPGLLTTARSHRTTLMGDRQIPIEEVRLAHFSVKEYLVSERIAAKGCAEFYIEEHLAHSLLAQLCIRYLIHCFQTDFCKSSDSLLMYETEFLDKAAFAPYAASFWSKHLQAADLDDSSPIHQEILALFLVTGNVKALIKLRRGWFDYEQVQIMRCCGYVLIRNGNHMYDLDFNSVPPLYYACLLGLDQLVSMLLDKGADYHCCTPEGSCLVAAVSSGRRSIVDLLLASGADVNAVILEERRIPEMKSGYKYSRTAIHEAVDKQNEVIVRVLLAAGADVNIERQPLRRDLSYEEANTPLQAAVHKFNKRLVRLMLDAGANPNAAAGGMGTALERASNQTRDTYIMTNLLDAGADPNLTSDPAGIKSSLHTTLAHYNLAGARLLVERGVDPQSIGPYTVQAILYNTILNSAKFQATMDLLIQIRPDFNLESALILAAKYGYATAMVKMLQNGTTPNAQLDGGTAALHAAAYTPACGAEAVQVLLEAGADVNLQGGPLGSALQAAALAGKLQVAKILLAKGSLVNHAAGLYGSALRIARMRLQDLEMQCPEVWEWKPAIGIESYGAVPGYLQEEDYLKVRTGTYKSPRDAAYEANINIAHLADADYRAIVDLLLSHGATDV